MSATEAMNATPTPAPIGQEVTLYSPAANGKTRVLLCDLSALASGEVVWLSFYGAVVPGGQTGLIKRAPFYGPILEWHTQSGPIPMPEGGTVTLLQTNGTPRVFPWRLLTID